MGRPEKLTKEQQAEVAELVRNGIPVSSAAKNYGVSEFTVRPYCRAAELSEAQAGQRAEEIRTAEEIAAESAPEAA